MFIYRNIYRHMLCVSSPRTLGSQRDKPFSNNKTWTDPIRRITLTNFISRNDHMRVVERAAALALRLRDENKQRKTRQKAKKRQGV